MSDFVCWLQVVLQLRHNIKSLINSRRWSNWVLNVDIAAIRLFWWKEVVLLPWHSDFIRFRVLLCNAVNHIVQFFPLHSRAASFHRLRHFNQVVLNCSWLLSFQFFFLDSLQDFYSLLAFEKLVKNCNCLHLLDIFCSSEFTSLDIQLHGLLCGFLNLFSFFFLSKVEMIRFFEMCGCEHAESVGVRCLGSSRNVLQTGRKGFWAWLVLLGAVLGLNILKVRLKRANPVMHVAAAVFGDYLAFAWLNVAHL